MALRCVVLIVTVAPAFSDWTLAVWFNADSFPGSSNDPRLITRSMHREYDITDATSDYFVLNGRSFPYTFRESLIVTGPNERTKLRVVNGGAKGIALHTHGHKFTVTHRDGVARQGSVDRVLNLREVLRDTG